MKKTVWCFFIIVGTFWITLNAKDYTPYEVLKAIEYQSFDISYYRFVDKQGNHFLLAPLYNGTFSLWRLDKKRYWQAIHNSYVAELNYEPAFDTFDDISLNSAKNKVTIGKVNSDIEPAIKPYAHGISNQTFTINEYFFYKRPFSIAIKPQKDRQSLYNFTYDRVLQPLHNAPANDRFPVAKEWLDEFDFHIRDGKIQLRGVVNPKTYNHYRLQNSINPSVNKSFDKAMATTHYYVISAETQEDNSSTQEANSSTQPDHVLQTEYAVRSCSTQEGNITSNIKVMNGITLSSKPLHIGHSSPINAIVAIDDNQVVSSEINCNIKIWNIGNSQLLKTIKVNAPIYDIALAKKNRHIVSANQKGLTIWQINSGDLANHIGDMPITAFDLYKKEVTFGAKIVGGSRTGHIMIWQYESGSLLTKIPAHTGEILALKINTKGMIVSSGDDGFMKLWSMESGDLLGQVKAHKGETSAIIFNIDGSQIISAGDDGFIRVWDSNTLEMLDRIAVKEAVQSLALSKKGTIIYANSGSVINSYQYNY